jgi:hypothetical protein
MSRRSGSRSVPRDATAEALRREAGIDLLSRLKLRSSSAADQQHEREGHSARTSAPRVVCALLPPVPPRLDA